MIYIVLFSVLLISYFGTYLIRKIAIHKNILDIPNIRSSHTEPTPRGGGVAIIISWFSGIIGIKILGLIEQDLFYALLAGSILAFIGLMDDIYSVKPWIRLVFQIITVALGLLFLDGFNSITIDGFTVRGQIIFNIIALVAGVWFVNLFNFLDGIDGYASLEAILVSFGMFLITHNLVLAVFILSISGFLFWNWPKAKIFMGDIGSTQLGYIIVVLGIYFNNADKINIMGLLILTSLFWIDASLTLFRRWRNNEKISQAHKKHAYQRIVQAGFSHKKTILFSILFNFVFIALVLISEYKTVTYFVTLPIAVLINYIIIRYIDHKKPFLSNGN